MANHPESANLMHIELRTELARRRQKAAVDSLGGRCVHGVNLYQDLCVELDCLNAVNQAIANQDRLAAVSTPEGL